jgi:hypothetical protein
MAFSYRESYSGDLNVFKDQQKFSTQSVSRQNVVNLESRVRFLRFESEFDGRNLCSKSAVGA